MPASGELSDLVDAFAEHRGRPVHLVEMNLGQGAVSGIWFSTDEADYIAYPDNASPERICAIVCHEIGHALLGHEDLDLAEQLIQSGRFSAVPPEMIRSILAARHRYEAPEEEDAELVGTHLAIELRRRLERGGDRFSDQRWD